MKFFVLLILLSFCCTSFGARRAVGVTGQSVAETGLIEVSIKVPGTFTTIDPTSSSWSGRMVLFSEIQLDNPKIKDHIVSITVEDTDGVVPAQLRSRFSEYPVLGRFIDTAATGYDLYYLNKTGYTRIDPPNLASAKLPSGVYVKLKVQKDPVPEIADTLTANIQWDDFQ